MRQLIVLIFLLLYGGAAFAADCPALSEPEPRNWPDRRG